MVVFNFFYCLLFVFMLYLYLNSKKFVNNKELSFFKEVAR